MQNFDFPGHPDQQSNGSYFSIFSIFTPDAYNYLETADKKKSLHQKTHDSTETES